MKKIYLLLTTCMLFTWAMSQTPKGTTVKPVYGKAGIKKTIAELQTRASATNGKVKSLNSPTVKPYRSAFEKHDNFIKPGRLSSNTAPLRRGNSNSVKPAVQLPMAGTNGDGATQQIWSDFLGIDFYENPIGWPPDPNGAVSNNQVIVCTNNGLKILDKPRVTERPLRTPKGYSRDLVPGLFITLENFFSAVIPDSSGISDPHIRYDRLSRRWFVVAIEVNPTLENNAVFLAVSDDDKITGTSSFTFYSFNRIIYVGCISL